VETQIEQNQVGVYLPDFQRLGAIAYTKKALTDVIALLRA
jgi:hypothetical protein